MYLKNEMYQKRLYNKIRLVYNLLSDEKFSGHTFLFVGTIDLSEEIKRWWKNE